MGVAGAGDPSPQLTAGPAHVPSVLLFEVEVARRLLLEPEPVVLGRLLEEVGRVLEHVAVVDRSSSCSLSSAARVRSSSSSSPRPPARPPARRVVLLRRAGSCRSGEGARASTASRLGCGGRLAGGSTSAPRPASAAGSHVGRQLGRRARSAARRRSRLARPRKAPRPRLAGSRRAPASPSVRACCATSRRAGPSASSSWRWSSSSGAPCLRFSSRCSLDGIVENAHRAEPYRGGGGRLSQRPSSARSTRFFPPRLAAIEGGVGGGDERRPVGCALRQRRHAEAGGDPQAARPVHPRHLERLDRLTHPLGQQRGAARLRLRSTTASSSPP